MLTENVLIGEEKENILREYIEKDLLNLELTNDLEVTNVYMILSSQRNLRVLCLNKEQRLALKLS